MIFGMIFALADRILLKKAGCFLVEFSIHTASEQRVLYLWREKIPAYWRDKLTFHLSWRWPCWLPQERWHFCHSDLPVGLVSAATSHFFMHYVPEPLLFIFPLRFGTGSQFMPASMLPLNADTPTQKKYSCSNTFRVENRVKWAYIGISSCYSKTGSCNQASLGVFTLGWMVKIYLATVAFWNDTLWSKDSLIL